MTIRARRLGLCVIVLVILLLTVGPALLLHLADSQGIKKNLALKLSQLTHSEIRIARLGASIFPRPGLDLKNITILPQGGKPPLLIKSAKFQISLFSLLKGKINIQKAVIQGVRLPIPACDTKTTNFSSEFSGFPMLFPRTLFSDLPASQKAFVVEIQDVGIGDNGWGELELRIDPSSKNISGTLDICPIRIDEKSIKRFFPKPGIRLIHARAFTADFNYTPSQGWHINWTLFRPGISLDTTPHKEARELVVKEMTGSLIVKRESVFIKITPFNLPSLAQNLSGELDLHMGESKSRLMISGKNILLKALRDLALEVFKENSICRDIFDIIRSGTAQEFYITFENYASNLFAPETMTIRGRMEKGSVKIPQTSITATAVNGTVTVKNGILKTEIEQGEIENSKIHPSILGVNLLSHGTLFNGDFKLDADLSRLPAILRDLLPATLLAREITHLSGITGRAEGELSLDHRDNTLSVGVTAGEITLSGAYSRLPGRFSISQGQFLLSGNTITLKDISGSMGKNRFSNIEASINMDKELFLDLTTGPAQLNPAQLFPWLTDFKPVRDKMKALSLAEITGQICLAPSSHIHGPLSRPGELKYDFSGQLIDMTLDSIDHPGEITNLNCGFHLTNKRTRLLDILGDMGNTGLLSHILENSLVRELSLPLSISHGAWEEEGSTAAFSGTLDFASGPSLFIRLKKTDSSFMVNQLTLIDEPRSHAFFLHDPENTKSPINFSGRVDTRSLTDMVTPDSPFAMKLKEWTQGSPFLLESGLGGTTLTGTHLNLKKITPLTTTLQMNDQNIPGAKSFLQSLKKITLILDRMTMGELTLSPFTADIELKNNTTSIKLRNSRLCSVDIEGEILFSPPSSTLSLNFQTDQKDLSPVLECFAEKGALIQGPVSLRGDLTGSGRPLELLKHLKGKFSLKSQNGRIHKLTLLSRILSVINISKFIYGQKPDIEQNGFGYQTIHIDADVEESRIVLKTAIIDGLDMKLIFNGWIDPASGTMDITGLVAPIKTADIIIEKIPILNTIMNNRLISFPFRAAGKIDDPKVDLLLPSQIGKGAIQTMQRILEAPFNLFKKQ